LSARRDAMASWRADNIAGVRALEISGDRSGVDLG
jgi:hypothetical protein